MAKKRKRSKPLAQPREPVKPSKRKKVATLALAVATVCVLGAATYFVFVRSDTPSSPTTDSSAANTTRKAATLDSLLKMTPEQLAEGKIIQRALNRWEAWYRKDSHGRYIYKNRINSMGKKINSLIQKKYEGDPSKVTNAELNTILGIK